MSPASPQSALGDLIQRVEARTRRSKELAAERHSTLAAPALLSRLSMPMKEMVYPISVARASGSHLTDVDGNDYVDLLMGFGVGLFGHNPAFIIDAVREQVERGIQIGAHDRHSGEVARLLTEITGTERAVFCNSGTEAVMLSLRLARAATGRDGVAFFTGAYHGQADVTLFRAGDDRGTATPRYLGVPSAGACDALVLEYGSAGALEIIEQQAPRLAAVLVEPVQRANVGLQPKEFLHDLRRITAKAGTLLIFDEVLNGFRLHPGGAQAWFDVAADLAVYGKVLGGGMPLGAIAGRARFVDFADGGPWTFGDDSGPRSFTTFVAGTFSKHPVAMAAAAAVLRRMKAEGVAICAELNARSSAFIASLDAAFRARGWPLRAVGCGSMFAIEATDGHPFAAGPGSSADLLYYHLLVRGVFASAQGPTYVLSTEHSEADLDLVREAFIDSLHEILRGASTRLPG